MEEGLITGLFVEEKDHWWHKAKRALICRWIRGRGLRILVVGVGGGMLCGVLKQAGHDVTGADISPEACVHVRRAFGIPVVQADLEHAWDFAGGGFDVVIAADVLEHISGERQFLARAFSSLRAGGMFIVTVPAYRHMWSVWDRRLGHLRRYSLCCLKEVLLESGFSIVRISYFHMILYPLVFLYRKVLRLPWGKARAGSDFAAINWPPVSFFWNGYARLERWILEKIDLPFGLSIMAVAVKHG